MYEKTDTAALLELLTQAQAEKAKAKSLRVARKLEAIIAKIKKELAATNRPTCRDAGEE